MAMHRGTFFCGLISVLLAATVLLGCPTLSWAQAFEAMDPAPLVLLVRHAEKASDPADDPPLTAAGEERAQALAAALRDAGVTAVITTQLRRTHDTAQPLAAARGITPEVVPVGWEDIADNARAVAAAVRRQAGEAVLVVGHANNIPAVIAALGGPHLPDICASVYANLFVLIPGAGEARLVRSRFGATDPDPGPDCK